MGRSQKKKMRKKILALIKIIRKAKNRKRNHLKAGIMYPDAKYKKGDWIINKKGLEGRIYGEAEWNDWSDPENPQWCYDWEYFDKRKLGFSESLICEDFIQGYTSDYIRQMKKRQLIAFLIAKNKRNLFLPTDLKRMIASYI